jgi:hypothetical protein
MKNLLAIGASLLLTSNIIHATTFGVGGSYDGEFTTVYVPIDLAETFRVEPYVRYNSNSDSSVQVDKGTTSNYTLSISDDSDSVEYGIGIFGIYNASQTVSFYYGAKVAYVKMSSDYVEKNQVDGFATYYSSSYTDIYTYSYNTQKDGLKLAPTIGFEYHFTSSFSIGAEVEFYYVKLSGDETETDYTYYKDSWSTHSQKDSEVTKIDSKYSGTDSRIVVRYRF